MNKHICRSSTATVIFIFSVCCKSLHSMATYFYLVLNPINPKVSLVFVGFKKSE